MTKTIPVCSIAWLAALGVANLLLLAAPGTEGRVAGAVGLLLMPGLAIAEAVFPAARRLLRWSVGLGTSLALVQCLTLLLHYLPGPLPMWILVVALDMLVAIPLLVGAAVRQRAGRTPDPAGDRSAATGPGRAGLWAGAAAVILAAAVGLRFAWLDYSEFQGDEALAMISAAEAIAGHADALFLRGKGPGEVLLPMALWRLTGTISEGTARLPFAVAGSAVPLVGFLLASSLLTNRRSSAMTGLVAAALLAFNGFMVAFARIVQYQSLVVLMSALALLCAWQWRHDAGRVRWLAWSGFFLGAGLLAHYDALLVMPAVAYVVLSGLVRGEQPPASRTVAAMSGGAVTAIIVAGLFYVPYLLDPQASRTGSYLGDRIGDQVLHNNLPSFQQLNTFYTSFYYYVLTGLLVLAALAWAARRAAGVRRLPGAGIWLPVVLVPAVLGLAIWPPALRTATVDLAGLPFALLLLCALLSAGLDDGRRAVMLWLAVPFLGYNFGVAVPLTHIYTIVPGWTLLAALAVSGIATHLHGRRCAIRAAAVVALIGVGLFAGYLVAAYLRHDVEFRQDWPRSRPALYWTPYPDPPATGFFGFPHRTGWKAVGALYADGRLAGDFGSNEEPDITAWYTRGAARACDPEPMYYFIADGLVDPWPVDTAAVAATYDVAGTVRLPHGRGLTIYQARPAADALESLDLATLAEDFDRSATPEAFARSSRGGQMADANLGALVRLVGYDVDARRARPGGRVAVTLYWQASKPLGEDFHVFVHLEADQIWGQADGRPVCWTYPTTDWRPGQVIADHHALSIRPDTPPGDYPLLVGMYSPTDGRRLDRLDADGQPVGNAVLLDHVTVH